MRPPFFLKLCNLLWMIIKDIAVYRLNLNVLSCLENSSKKTKLHNLVVIFFFRFSLTAKPRSMYSLVLDHLWIWCNRAGNRYLSRDWICHAFAWLWAHWGPRHLITRISGLLSNVLHYLLLFWFLSKPFSARFWFPMAYAWIIKEIMVID